MLYRGAIGTVFLLQGFDKERTQNLLKKVFLRFQDIENRPRELDYI